MVRHDFKRTGSDWRWLGLIVGIVVVWAAGRWVAPPEREPPTNVKAIASRGDRAVTRPIESIRVGQRVLARNPEVTAAERTARAEPNWAQWVHVSLELPLPASADQPQASLPRRMKIELLRPEAWVLERLSYVAQLRDEAERVPTAALDAAEGPPSLLIPMRELYLETARLSDWMRQQNIEQLGRQLDLELVEMGAVGRALVTDIRPCPEIAAGDGQVVTATFEHPPNTQVLDVRFGDDSALQLAAAGIADAESPALGVTENHLFWSVDAQQFMPIGQLEVGQRVLTYQGEIKRIVSKLPRPGPERVYNLEVYGEHVYFVGQQGLLAHNNCELGDLGEKGAKGWLKRHGYTEVMQFQNPSGHGLDIVARHRDGTLTFFEVKTSTGGRAPGLTEAQADQATYIVTRLNKAASAGPWWRKTPLAVRSRADDLFNDIRMGAKYRRYRIEITNATNSAAPTQFRILPWSP